MCYGEDGHIEVEVSINGSCKSDENSRANEPSGKNTELKNVATEHCGPCKDVTITDTYQSQDRSRANNLNIPTIKPTTQATRIDLNCNDSKINHERYPINATTQNSKIIRTQIILI